MRPVYKLLIILCLSILIVWGIIALTDRSQKRSTAPERIPTYEEIVPRGFSALGVERVLDARDSHILMEPRLPIVKLADSIVEAACPNRHPDCRLQAIYRWVQLNIQHMEVLRTRDHVISPEETILYREGDDQTMSILLIALLRAEGFDGRMAVTPYISFVEVQNGENTIRLDPGCGNCNIGSTRYNGPDENIQWVG